LHSIALYEMLFFAVGPAYRLAPLFAVVQKSYKPRFLLLRLWWF